MFYRRDAERLIADFESSEASSKLSDYSPSKPPPNFYAIWVENTITGLNFTKPVGTKELLEKIENSTDNTWIKRRAQSGLRTFN